MRTMSVSDRVAALPPGPGLSAALAGLDLSTVPGGQVVDVLRAQARQLAHEQARLLATMVELSRTVPGAEVGGRVRAGQAFGWAAGEVAAALRLTARAADREMGFAEAVVSGLPVVFAALWAGELDRAKAWVFADHLDPDTCGLTPTQIEAVCTQLVPPASGWTTGQLVARLLRAIIAIDPEHARRRYDQAVRERQVVGFLDDAGTVTITATGLPIDQAAAACERLEQLAAAVKRAGHPGRLSQIRADVFLGLLEGRYHGLTREQLITDLLTRAADTGPDPEVEVPTQPAEPTPSAEPTHPGGPARSAGPTRPTRSGAPPHRPTLAAEPALCTEQGGHQRAGVEIRVGLSTLLRLDERPGEIPGLGPVIAPVARALVAAQNRGAQWRFAVTDADGYLLLAGTTHRRPTRTRQARQGGRCRGGIVELHIPAELLHRLTHDHTACGDWAGVIADIARQFARRDALTDALDRNPATRFVRGALARHIQVRDRTCSHPGCRCPARKADLDHTRDHAHGGSTTRANTGPGCGRHHWYKTELGWRLRQPRPGHFVWISPLGRVYRTRGEPIAPPLPEPAPAPQRPEARTPPPTADPPRILRHLPPDATPRPPPTSTSGSDPPPF